MVLNKFRLLLRSRKFWAAVVGLVAVLAASYFKNVDADTLVNAIMVIVSVFMGATAVEDGLRK